jgi:glycine/D-amino acid oxidase-like deaminating enzyme
MQFEKWCGIKNCLSTHEPQTLKLPGLAGVISNPYEGQIDTGKTMYHLQQLFVSKGGSIINSLEVKCLNEEPDRVLLDTPLGVFRAGQVVVAINGFARQLLEIEDVRPARAQVLVTAPVPGLALRGTFHADKGFIYFRNVGDRILLGGARNLDFETESTTASGLNRMIQALWEWAQKSSRSSEGSGKGLLPHSGWAGWA